MEDKNDKIKQIKQTMKNESISLPLICKLLDYNYKSISQIFSQLKSGECYISHKKINKMQEKIQQIIELKENKND